jgi:hypothetical protein
MKLTRDIPAMQRGDGYWYLASPFTNYKDGHEQAWIDVCYARGWLLQRGIFAYSPIAESWGAVRLLNLPFDHVWWQGDNESKMAPAVGIIVAKLEGWEDSEGIKREVAWFQERGRPRVDIEY